MNREIRVSDACRMLHIGLKQRELHKIIIKYKDGMTRRLTELNPLRKFVFNKINGLSVHDKDDVFSVFLWSVFSGRFVPQERYTYQYIRRRMLSSLRKCGFIKNFRGKYSKGGPMRGVVFFDDLNEAKYGDGGF